MRHHMARDRIWRLVDAKDQVLGRVAGQIATLLQGKFKPTYMDNMWCGDPVVVINARHAHLTGRKWMMKHYRHYTGYPGGQRNVPIQYVWEKRPTDPIRLAVRGMLPKNRLRRTMMENLYIFAEEEHDKQSHNPAPMFPAHVGSRVGHGYPPTRHELETWWLDHISLVPDDILERTMEAAEKSIPKRKHGLAELLRIEGEDQEIGSVDASALSALRGYVSAAQNDTSQHASYPVIVPPSILK